jgi:zinc/manganese transport system permease protein
MAAAVGMRLKPWALVTSAWLGLAVGLSIRSAGMLYTFGCLILSALVAKNLCREVRPMFVVAPLVAVSTAAVGFVLTNYYDDPPAQMTIALLCALFDHRLVDPGLMQQPRRQVSIQEVDNKSRA